MRTLISNFASLMCGRDCRNKSTIGSSSKSINCVKHLYFNNMFNSLQRLTKMKNEVLLSLMQSLEGPQDIEAELKMTPFTDGQPVGTIVQKIMVFVSEFAY